jgi:signal transduction histidine kinase
MLLDQKLVDRPGAADWTIDPRAQSRDRRRAAATKPAADRRQTAMPDRRSPTAPVDRRRAPTTASLRASEIFRPFFGTSFVAILVTAMLLMLCYRYFTMQAVAEQTGETNIVAADAAQSTNHEQIADFLALRATKPDVPFPAEISAHLHELVKDTPVERVRIINAQGKVVFSTGPDLYVNTPMESQVVSDALAGRQSSKLKYRDVFNSFAFNSSPDEDNMVVTGLPLQQQHQGPILGVFEMQTNVSTLVAHHENAQLLIAGTATLLMLLLYGSLLTNIRRIGRIIDVQHDALRERSDLLAELSAGMMNVQEEEKQRIAEELHERVAQTLAAIKFNIESTTVNVRQTDAEAAAMLQALLAPVHDAIQDVRATASSLRPSSLDDLGLLPTLRGLWRELAEKRPDLKLEYTILVTEEDVPAPLRPIVFRAAEDAAAALATDPSVKRAGFLLSVTEDQLILGIRDDAMALCPETEPQHPFARVRERALLSGGNFTCRANSWGGLAVKASWPLAHPRP